MSVMIRNKIIHTGKVHHIKWCRFFYRVYKVLRNILRNKIDFRHNVHFDLSHHTSVKACNCLI